MGKGLTKISERVSPKFRRDEFQSLQKCLTKISAIRVAQNFLVKLNDNFAWHGGWWIFLIHKIIACD